MLPVLLPIRSLSIGVELLDPSGERLRVDKGRQAALHLWELDCSKGVRLYYALLQEVGKEGPQG